MASAPKLSEAREFLAANVAVGATVEGSTLRRHLRMDGHRQRFRDLMKQLCAEGCTMEMPWTAGCKVYRYLGGGACLVQYALGHRHQPVRHPH
jgi:hypothetical protein